MSVLVRRSMEVRKANVYFEQQFTAVGLSTWIVPPGCKSIDAFVVGGGGGGGCATVFTRAYRGYGGMCKTYSNIPVTPGEKIDISVGTGGSAGTTTSTYGQAGGSSYFKDMTYIAQGGSGGAGGRTTTDNTTIGGEAGSNGTYPFGDTSKKRCGASGGNGGGSGAPTVAGGTGGDYGGGTGGSSNRSSNRGGSAGSGFYYGAGGGGGGKGNNYTGSGGSGGFGYQGYILIRGYKY